MFACCETGYCESEAVAEWADETFGPDWQEQSKALEDKRFISEDDLPLGEEERDYLDVGEFLASFTTY